jgi:hypothetical protein
MKKILFTIILLTSISSTYSQWSFQSVSNDFDDPYRIAYTSENNGAILKLERLSDGGVMFYIQSSDYCDADPYVDLVFVVNGVNVKYYIEGVKNNQSDMVFFTADLVNSELLESFKKCSVLKVRVNQEYCDSEIYSFNMSKSTSALNFINY